MKKLMIGAAVAAITFGTAAPSFAREVTNVVGYVKTETVYNDRDAEFAKADENHDGNLSFKEFQKAALLDNEYEMFKMNDTNNDGILSLDEFRKFSKQGPARVGGQANGTITNFNKPSTRTKVLSETNQNVVIDSSGNAAVY